MVRKKKFFEIELPIINQKIELYAYEEEELIGKTVKIDLTRKLRGKSLEIIFKINKNGEKLKPEPQRLHLLGYFIRRMMRKSISYVEDSFSVQCKNAKLKIKPFLITRKKVSRAVRKALREKVKEEIEKQVKDKKYQDIFSELLENKFQKNLSIKLKKVYPLSLCEIRDFFIENKPEERTKTKTTKQKAKPEDKPEAEPMEKTETQKETKETK
ncbi:MAG: hypothetical protein ABIH72_02480 [archaeon]